MFYVIFVIIGLVIAGVVGLYYGMPATYNSIIAANCNMCPVAATTASMSPTSTSPPMTSVPIPPPAAATPAVVPVTPAAAAVTPAAAVAPITSVAPPAGTIMQSSPAGQVAVPTITPAAAVTKYNDPAAGVIVGCIQTTYQNSSSSSSQSGPATGKGPASCIINTVGKGPCSQQGLMGPPNCAGCGVDPVHCNQMAALYAQMYAGGDLSGTYTY